MIYINRGTTVLQIPRTAMYNENYYTKAEVDALLSQKASKALEMSLPQENTTYGSREAMLEALGITAEQLNELLVGGFAFVNNTNSRCYLSLMMLSAVEIYIGYSFSQGEEVYVINLAENSIHYIVL